MIKKMADNFFFIERGWLNGNHFVFNGKSKILIDTGYKKNLEQTVHLINRTGVDIRQVELIVSTHCHCDHIGGNRYIQELSGCEIGMHPIDRHFIETKNDWYTWWRYYDQ
ncbi:MAG: MBL fold metallo-hydrolase, partial [Bacillota bacterium]